MLKHNVTSISGNMEKANSNAMKSKDICPSDQNPEIG